MTKRKQRSLDTAGQRHLQTHCSVTACTRSPQVQVRQSHGVEGEVGRKSHP